MRAQKLVISYSDETEQMTRTRAQSLIATLWSLTMTAYATTNQHSLEQPHRLQRVVLRRKRMDETTLNFHRSVPFMKRSVTTMMRHTSSITSRASLANGGTLDHLVLTDFCHLAWIWIVSRQLLRQLPLGAFEVGIKTT